MEEIKTMSNQAVDPTRNGFNHFFDPQTYLEENFKVVDDEDKFTIQFIYSSLKPIEDQLLIH